MRALATTLLLALGAFAPLADAQIVHPDREIEAPGHTTTGWLDEGFGQTLAIDGDRLAIGAPNNDYGKGAVYVFERSSSGAFEEVAFLTHQPIVGVSNSFGIDVALEGDRLVVGTWDSLVRVYERGASGAWSLVSTILEPNVDDDWFGLSVALEGDRIAVTARASDHLDGPPHLYVFERDPGGAWPLVGSATLPMNGHQTDFGLDLAMSGDLIAVGVPRDPNTTIWRSGSVYLAQPSAGDWDFFAGFTAPVPEPGARFGDAIAFGDGRLFVGETHSDAAGESSGSVHVFTYGRSGITHEAEFQANDTAPMDRFGSDLEVDGDDLVVAAPGAHAFTGEASGVVYHFVRREDGSYFQSGRIELPDPTDDDELGRPGDQSIGLDDGRLVLGSPMHDDEVGVVYEIDLLPLLHRESTIESSIGGMQHLELRAGADRAGHAFFLLGSLGGTSPGIALGGGVEVPLVLDAYTSLTASGQGSFVNGSGWLGPDGEASSIYFLQQFKAEPLAGLAVFHAFVTIDPFTFDTFASNAVAVELTP